MKTNTFSLPRRRLTAFSTLPLRLLFWPYAPSGRLFLPGLHAGSSADSPARFGIICRSAYRTASPLSAESRLRRAAARLRPARGARYRRSRSSDRGILARSLRHCGGSGTHAHREASRSSGATLAHRPLTLAAKPVFFATLIPCTPCSRISLHLSRRRTEAARV